MKRTTILMLGFLIIILQACAQTTDVPQKAKDAFAKKFPTAKKVKWDKENKTEWEAEFKMNGKEYSANFSSDGSWMETEYEIKKSDLPEAVKKTLMTEFSEYKIEEIELSETPDGKVYEFAFEKGETEMEVAISPDGKVLKREMQDEENDND